ncbi:hypothetical protein OROHE_016391 [Orobanche hederae]
MRIHNFRLIFNEYDAILSPTYVGNIIIKVCVVGFGRTNYQFSRNTATSGFNLAIRIHDFGLSEENDAIILQMWNSVTNACNENSQFQTNYDEYDAVLLCSYVAHVIIKVCVVVFGRKNDQLLRNTGTLEFRLANEIPLFWPNSDNYYDVLPPSYVVHVIIKELAMRIHDFGLSEESDAIILCTYVLIFNEYDAILSPTYVGHIIIKVCVVGFGRTNDQFSRNTATSGFSLAMRIHDFGLSEENDAIILRTYVGHTIVKVRVNSQFQTNSDEYDAVLLCSYVAHVIIKVCVVVFGRKNDQFLRNTGTLEFRLANENPLFWPNSDNYYDVLPPSYVVHVIIKE